MAYFEDETAHIIESRSSKLDELKALAERAAQEDGINSYHISLTSLVDGVSTYTLSYDDGEVLTFPNYVEPHNHIIAKRIRRRVEVIYAALISAREAGQERIEALEKSLEDLIAASAAVYRLSEKSCSEWFALNDALANARTVLANGEKE